MARFKVVGRQDDILQLHPGKPHVVAPALGGADAVGGVGELHKFAAIHLRSVADVVVVVKEHTAPVYLQGLPPRGGQRISVCIPWMPLSTRRSFLSAPSSLCPRRPRNPVRRARHVPPSPFRSVPLRCRSGNSRFRRRHRQRHGSVPRRSTMSPSSAAYPSGKMQCGLPPPWHDMAAVSAARITSAHVYVRILAPLHILPF